ncbi:MAG: hypothetical protein HQ536_05065 [Parcubacteria group bacterium]|nr:hypothetical protein [Parcubacteria group bacterium]
MGQQDRIFEVNVDRSKNMAGMLVGSDCGVYIDQRIRRSQVSVDGDSTVALMLLKLEEDVTFEEALEAFTPYQGEVELADFAELMAFNNAYPEEKEDGPIIAPSTLFEDKGFGTKSIACIYVYEGRGGRPERRLSLHSASSKLWKGSRILLRVVS